MRLIIGKETGAVNVVTQWRGSPQSNFGGNQYGCHMQSRAARASRTSRCTQHRDEPRQSRLTSPYAPRWHATRRLLSTSSSSMVSPIIVSWCVKRNCQIISHFLDWPCRNATLKIHTCRSRSTGLRRWTSSLKLIKRQLFHSFWSARLVDLKKNLQLYLCIVNCCLIEKLTVKFFIL